MGLSGLAIALQRAGGLWSHAAPLGDFVALLTMLAFIVLLLQVPRAGKPWYRYVPISPRWA